MRYLSPACVLVLSIISWKMVSSDLSSLVTCAAQEFLDGSRTTWQCRVVCDLVPEALKGMGSVDAFAAVLGPRDSGKQVNIRGGYNSTTGKFIVSIAGVYKVGLYVFAAGSSEGKLDLIVKKQGRWEKTACAAHSDADSYRAASCGTLLQLEEGALISGGLFAVQGVSLKVHSDCTLQKRQ